MTDAIHKYDDVETDWTNKMMPGDYEPVYHEPNYLHVNKPTGECVLFDDATYGVKPRDYEVVCQNPNVTQEKGLQVNMYTLMMECMLTMT